MCCTWLYCKLQVIQKLEKFLAKDINRRFGTNFAGKNLFITGGAAGAITITF